MLLRTQEKQKRNVYDHVLFMQKTKTLLITSGVCKLFFYYFFGEHCNASAPSAMNYKTEA